MSVERTIDGWIKTNDAAELTACGETMAVVRKKCLLRILACQDADRANISITGSDIQATSDWFRRGFGLLAEEDFSHWIESQKLTKAAFASAMHDFTIVRLLEQAYAEEIDELVPNQIAISTARLRSGT
ncbi:hypothetical protein FXV83_00725 [Bradyrhizobium hipponense]|uniref:Uncharacterized protein n=1 Tax=Bradyrhizobium hipponense TaxID=2605638 RepID=A0A5S4YXQ5_9BRAD|nr:hypothetical protein [Bradyrhizobium hipponense]TYO68389.1 hypothetical protein FXV83_00725 [Bradyrhizobium hipponense]